MVSVYISIGSNIERERNVSRAIASLRAKYAGLKRSSVYETEAVGFEGDPFYNLVAAFETVLPVREVQRWLREIESEAGRDRTTPRFASRTLDIDLLLFGDLVVDEDGLALPRGEITLNSYVLKPLAEIAGGNTHPTLGQTYAELWTAMAPSADKMTLVDMPNL